MLEIRFVPYEEIVRIRHSNIDEYKKLQILSDICRLNAFSAVKKAGSGHLGSSFSALDILVFLYFKEMNVLELGISNPNRDIYFSSKGHDCPGQYSVLFAAGIINYDKLLNLRRLGGLDGHPDIRIPGIEANSGSLGMGISKAKGMALAKKMKGLKGRIFVMTGDGELQEGQIWEALQTTVHQKITNVNVIVDFNKIQTDKPLKEIIDLGDLEKKFEVFGWYVKRCDGHDFRDLEDAFSELKEITDRPKVLIADTIKGKGVSFMEGPTALEQGNGLYRWHAGAPDDDSYEAGFAELIDKINGHLRDVSLEPVKLELVETRQKGRVRLKDVAEKVVNAYGEALVEIGKRRKDIIVLDADLSADCGLRPFENTFPDRFIENGIAEQDMVSMAGGLALQGYLPIVNSFGVFLASRANEQIYTNATENTKIIYVCHYAGLIPAGPGKSHQSLRDISLFGALPNCIIVEPCNAIETKKALQWCVDESRELCMMRLVISPSPRTILFPDNYEFSFGKGTVLKDGEDVIIFSYGPVMLNEALKASEILEKENISLKVVNMPWINRIDKTWFENILTNFESIFVLDNHSIYGGLGDFFLNVLMESDNLRGKRLYKLAINEFPECGTPVEVLKYHRLDAESLASFIKTKIFK
ncbi:1-deoxy-D-xylulose-5-phosphate synthase [Thermosulfuriphilus ammonigenes]|uniref:1-deoxy-D-xylulose-5-phosphate synthase n=1 Tax=Thermosulfuriphilus ammonigenes TaxID=1936021 RepID=A0A6G7PY69_9BACT|nr:transketolase C-terminal domain-containing protein [Thermosulfuriphilus ammonigenes]MBA2849541.1 transketolase [Thermosulfuriphilus ammonigenes]QIJ72353.1 1-deoxy-D-xylulose-5-phosphate synthase [Thermosulfuriphilus ammonigenes]